MMKKVLNLSDWSGKTYSDVAYANGTAFISGQMSLDENNQPVRGTIEEETARALDNLKKVVEKLGAGLDDVLFTQVILLSNDDFPGFSSTYAKYFPNGYPARVATIAKEIYLGLRLELCAVVALDRSNEDKNV